MKNHARSTRMASPRIPASTKVRVLNIGGAEEPSESESESVEEEESVEEGGTEVPGVTVLVKNPMSEVEVSAVVL
jgi:hypothetical protein